TTVSTAPVAQGSIAPATGSSAASAGSISKPIATTNPAVASGPATNPIVTQEQASSSAASSGFLDRFSRPGNLFIGFLLLVGILFLVWLVAQQARRNLASAYDSSSPLTEPPFPGEDSGLRAGARNLISTGPPRLSLNLKATEPAVNSVVL